MLTHLVYKYIKASLHGSINSLHSPGVGGGGGGVTLTGA